MKPESSKLRHTTEEQLASDQQTQVIEGGGKSFESVEELLRFDAVQHPPAPSVESRLQESIAQEPKPLQPWWRRLFGG